MTRIPFDPIGFSVSEDGTIHTRYADHGNGTRTRTEKGVRNLLNGKRGKACVQCYGKTPRYASTTPAPQKEQVRRVPQVESSDAAALPRD